MNAVCRASQRHGAPPTPVPPHTCALPPCHTLCEATPGAHTAQKPKRPQCGLDPEDWGLLGQSRGPSSPSF